ncbi:hypothetical protein TrVGV298_002114 [Trichoderma virens]|nr:hypothetical protein TrVGV298_002114 [Trichoderma virens]
MAESGPWTVAKTRSRRRGPAPKLPASPSRAVPELTPEEIKKDFDTFKAQFKASPCRKALHKIVLNFVLDSFNDGNFEPVDEAICLGIGSFDPPDGSWQLKKRAHTQLAAMLHMVKLLEKETCCEPISCIFQEPAFTSSDIAFLTAMGHKVVDSPIASDSVGAGTFFFGPHLYRDVYAMSLKGDLPAIWVGTGWDIWQDVIIGSLEEDEEPLLAIKEMEETYKRVPFPEVDKESTIFHGTSVYFRTSICLQGPGYLYKGVAAVEEEEEEAATETKDTGEAKEETPTTSGDTSTH